MAITGTDRGTGTHNTSALSFTLSPASNLAAGSWAVLVIAVDNADTSGTAHSTFTVTDTLGNTWTRRISPLYDPGAASAGVEGAIFTTPQNGGTLTTGTTITVTFDANTTAKAWTLMEIVPSSGFYLKYVNGGVNTGSATASPTVTTGSIDSGDIVIGALFNEQGTGQTVTGDSDTSNGSWSTQQTAEVGTTGAGMTVSSQRKVVTATATQTFNPTLGVSSDVILGWIQLTEAKIAAMAQRLTVGIGAALLGLVMAADEAPQPSSHDLHEYRKPVAAASGGRVGHAIGQLVIVEAEQDAARAPHGARLLFGRATPAAVSATWPLWQRAPAQRAEDDETRRVNHNGLHLYRVGYQTVGQPFITRPVARTFIEDEPDARRTDHSLHAYRKIAVAATTGHVVRETTQLVLVEAERDADRADHSAHFFFHRSTAVVPAQPITGSTDHPQVGDEFEIRPDHEVFFRYQRPAITAPSVVPLWRWPAAKAGQDVEPAPTVTDHAAALYPFRPHEAVEPPLVLPVAAITQLVIVEAEQDARRTFHAAGLFFNRVPAAVPSQVITADVAHPQEGEQFEVRPDHEVFFRYQRPAIIAPDSARLWFWPAAEASQAIEPNPRVIDHAAALYPFRPHDAIEPPPAPPAETRGAPHQLPWVAYVNGKRYVGSYWDIRRIIEELAEKQAERDRVTDKPKRVRITVQPGKPVVSHETALPKPAALEMQREIRDFYQTAYARVTLRLKEIDDDDEDVLLLL